MEFDSIQPQRVVSSIAAVPKVDTELIDRMGNDKNKKMEASSEIPPKIFNLDVDCVQEIFDYLSIKDIHSVSETCTRMQRIAGDYLQSQLAAMEIYFYNDEHFQWKGYQEFVRSLTIFSTNNIKGYRYIGLHCKSLKKIRFSGSNLDATKIEYLKPILSKIESVTFYESTIEDEFYEHFPQLCSNLKCLRIINQYRNITSNKWLLYNYPKVEHLHIFLETDYPELGTFFEQNPSLQKLSIDSSGFLRNINVMLQSKIKLQVLILCKFNKDEDEVAICRHLNQLHDQGFYKRLFFDANIIDQQTVDRISAINGLERLKVGYYNRSLITLNLNSLENIKELAFNCETFPSDLETIAKSFVNLERLYFNQIEFEMIEPFIQYAAKLKAIKICYLTRDTVIDLSTLNKKREKLAGARKVIIYLKDHFYLPTKWNIKTTDLKMIGLKRIESIDW